MKQCAGGASSRSTSSARSSSTRTAASFPFEIDPFSRECLLEGLDEIALTLRRADEIDRYEAATAGRVDTLSL